MLEAEFTKVVVMPDKGKTVLFAVVEYYGECVNVRVPYSWETLDIDGFLEELREQLAKDFDLPVYRISVPEKELIDRIAEQTQAKRVLVKLIIQSFLDELTDQLSKGNRLEFRDFGVFEARTRSARIAQNPKTLERVEVPAKKTVKFKMGRLMKQKINVPVTQSTPVE